jgi:ATP-dependent RNA helicase DeaD
VAPRERRLLSSIEHTTRQKIEEMHLPTTQNINDSRIDRFKMRVIEALQMDDLEFYQNMIEQLEVEKNIPAVEIAAGLARLMQGDIPFFMDDKPQREVRTERNDRPSEGGQRRDRSDRPERGERRGERSDRPERPRRERSENPEEGMNRYRLEVGRNHGVKPGNIVGCIANEGGIDSEFIRQLNIDDTYSTVDLPADMPKEALTLLAKSWVCGQQLKISQIKGGAGAAPRKRLTRNKADDKDKGKPRPRRS